MAKTSLTKMLTFQGRRLGGVLATFLLGMTLTFLAFFFFTYFIGPSCRQPPFYSVPPSATFQRLANPSIPEEQVESLRRALHFVWEVLPKSEQQFYSQNNEDGVIIALFNFLAPDSKYYVEFGTESGRERNTRYINERLGWKGLLMDGDNEDDSINLHQELIFAENIVSLFEKYNVPKMFDLLSVDTDMKDFWITQAILEDGFRPRVVITEVNDLEDPSISRTVPKDDPQKFWIGNRFYGVTLQAYIHLFRWYGYSLVYCENEGVNCFWVIDGPRGFGSGFRLSDYTTAKEMYKVGPRYRKPNYQRRWVIISSDTEFGPGGIVKGYDEVVVTKGLWLLHYY